MPDQSIQATENMIGANHPTLADTLNRLTLVGHYSDGTHRNISLTTTNNTYAFTVAGATTGYSTGIMSNTGANFQFGVSTSTGGFWGESAGSYYATMGSGNAPLVLAGNGTATMMLKSGNVLIGSQTDNGSGSKLQLTGNESITGNLTVSGTALISTTAAIGVPVTSSTALNLVGSTTALSPIRLTHGVTPTSPIDGDMWTTSAGLFIRINGVTKTVTLT